MSEHHIRSGGNGVRHEEFEFPGAVSPGRESRAVVALYEQMRAAQVAPQSVHRLQRRRQMREVQPVMFTGGIHAFFLLVTL